MYAPMYTTSIFIMPAPHLATWQADGHGWIGGSWLCAQLQHKMQRVYFIEHTYEVNPLDWRHFAYSS